jgi:hypothetical protein
VVKGGPWRCSEDAVLIAPFREGEDPESVKFSSIPIWVQFRNIPFYLLSKTLAKVLAMEVGDFICIDNFSRGDMCDKYIRARVHMPIDRAIRRWIPIIDGIEDEEVVVNLHYERLPNFCFFCGFIGHKDTTCDKAGTLKNKYYSRDLSVRPTLMEDTRRWLLPDKTEMEKRAAASNTQNWRNQQHRQNMPLLGQASVTGATVATEVRSLLKDASTKLCISDNKTAPTTMTPTKIGIIVPSTTVGQEKASRGAQEGALEPLSMVLSIPPDAKMADRPKHERPRHEKASTKDEEPSNPENKGKQGKKKEKNSVAAGDKTKGNHAATWKRRIREETGVQKIADDVRATQGPNLGATRQREESEEQDASQPAKKILYQVPSLEESLGVEGLRRLREYEENVVPVILKGIAESVNKNVKGAVYKPVEEVAENVVEQAAQTPLSPGAQVGSSWREGELKEVKSKKTEPETVGKEPGTKEGAWRKI